MNTQGQNIATPPTPPTPPNASASISSAGITYASSSTDNSFAFSCSFNEDYHKDIVSIVKKHIKDYTDEYLNKVYTQQEETYYYSIELKQTELKLEYKFDNTSKENQESISTNFKAIESDILSL